jgi:quinol monooxygenase YgiN
MGDIERHEPIVNLTRVTVPPEHRQELWQTISSLIGEVRSEKGCLTYNFYEEGGDENTFVLIGEWETGDDWNSHLNSNNFAVLLGSIMLLCFRSEIDFKLLSPVIGMEAAARARVWSHA